MRKYRYIYKATLMESLSYVMNIVLGFIIYFMILYVLINLWEYIYSDSTNLINGYSKQQMIWYVILTESIGFGARSRTLTTQMSLDIKSGTIAYGINKPYHYNLYILSKYLGEITLQFLLFFGAGIIIGSVFVGTLPGLTLWQLPFAMMCFFFGVLINAFIYMSISSLSFWMEDPTPFRWIYDKMIIVVGTLFPVELFPHWIQPLIKCLPIYVINYGPAKLVIDFSFSVAARVFLAQFVYLALGLMILFILYRKGVKKLNVNGG